MPKLRSSFYCPSCGHPQTFEFFSPADIPLTTLECDRCGTDFKVLVRSEDVFEVI